MGKIRTAIAGVGNCASSLVQGVEYYGNQSPNTLSPGIRHPLIHSWGVGDIEFVAAFDIDKRKVGRPLHEAIFAPPNCAKVFQPEVPESDTIVQMSPIMDGFSEHMYEYDEASSFRPSSESPVDVAEVLAASGAEVLVCYLPVGSVQAAQYFAEACLAAKVAMINCIPVFIASDPSWANRFKDAGVPIIGDDVKSQVGATIVHRVLSDLFGKRGVSVDRTYQLNTGGNTDFLNMKSSERLVNKKISKSEAVQSQLATRLKDSNIHIGPSDYVPWQKDNKLCFIRLEGTGFGDQPVEVEIRMSVEDSANSGGVVIDAIRYAKLALERGLAGPVIPVSAFYMKSPPIQYTDAEAYELTLAFLEESLANPIGTRQPALNANEG